VVRTLASTCRGDRQQHQPLISRELIIRIANSDGVDNKTVQRDYVIAHVLEALARLPSAEGMIFKGGTALRMCHYEGYRYSADLDFSLAEGVTKDEALGWVVEALDAAKAAIGFPTLELEPEKGKARTVAYEGPVGVGKPVKLDIADDELVFSPERQPIFRRYEDLSGSDGVPVYSLVEITAEKFRCIIQRSLCRDVFDLHFLLEEAGVDLDDAWDMFEEKARHKGKDPMSFFARLDALLEGFYRQQWEAEMSEHLPGELPHFNAVERELKRRVKPKRP
jgi:uncharacterized protein